MIKAGLEVSAIYSMTPSGIIWGSLVTTCAERTISEGLKRFSRHQA